MPALAAIQPIRGFFARRKRLLLKGAACLALLAVCVVPALFVNNIIGYLPALIVACALVYCGIYAFIMRKNVSFEELSSLASCERGSRLDFTVRIENKSFLLLSRVEPSFYLSDLFGSDESVMKRVTSLAPFEKRDFNFSLRFDHIGAYSAGLHSIRIYDLIGLFTFTMGNANRYEITVTPRIFDVSSLQVANELTSESQKMLTSVINDGMDYAGMRDYAMGDPMKSVHWKMSARSKKLVTKLYETYVNPTMAIIFDFHTYPYDRETMMGIYDAIVETGLSIDHYARSNNIDSVVVFQDRRGVRRREETGGLDRYGALVGELPRITSSELEGVACELVASELDNPYAANNLVVCTSCFDDALISTLASARNRGKTPMLFGIIPRSLPADERRRITRSLRHLDSAATPYFILDSADELKERL